MAHLHAHILDGLQGDVDLAGVVDAGVEGVGDFVGALVVVRLDADSVRSVRCVLVPDLLGERASVALVPVSVAPVYHHVARVGTRVVHDCDERVVRIGNDVERRRRLHRVLSEYGDLPCEGGLVHRELAFIHVIDGRAVGQCGCSGDDYEPVLPVRLHARCEPRCLGVVEAELLSIADDAVCPPVLDVDPSLLARLVTGDDYCCLGSRRGSVVVGDCHLHGVASGLGVGVTHGLRTGLDGPVTEVPGHGAHVCDVHCHEVEHHAVSEVGGCDDSRNRRNSRDGLVSDDDPYLAAVVRSVVAGGCAVEDLPRARLGECGAD